MSTSGGRIPQNANDWMRDMERRLDRLERRPNVSSAQSILGNGIGPLATRVVDWNSPETLLNGWYFSDALSVNGPDPDFAWLGMVINSYPGHGIQVLWSHDLVGSTAPQLWRRQFHRHNGERVADFGAWFQAVL